MSETNADAPAKALPDFDGLFRTPRPVGLPVHAQGLGKSFGAKRVLRRLDFTIPAGQFVAIVGRSGCGKSTLLRLVAGLDRPDAGRLDFGPLPGKPPVRVMFQEPRLLPWARVLENVEIGLGDAPKGRAQKDEARRNAQAALASVGLADRAQDWPSILSGGQKQRVALARALLSKPRLLAFDEPLGALDALTRIEMQHLLEEVWQQEKFTALLVTHDVAEALTLADRILMIEDGMIALDLPIDLPRPRRRGSVDLAVLEERILNRLIRDETRLPEYTI